MYDPIPEIEVTETTLSAFVAALDARDAAADSITTEEA
jgi:hypothetical protein